MTDPRELLDQLVELHGRVIRNDYTAEWLRLTQEHDALPALVATIRAVLDLTYASDDGTEWDHNGHGRQEGEPECPGCWAAAIRATVTDALIGSRNDNTN